LTEDLPLGQPKKKKGGSKEGEPSAEAGEEVGEEVEEEESVADEEPAVVKVTTQPRGKSYLESISHRCYLFEVAFVWELTKETISLPLGCLQRGHRCVLFLEHCNVARRPVRRTRLRQANCPCEFWLQLWLALRPIRISSGRVFIMNTISQGGGVGGNWSYYFKN